MKYDHDNRGQLGDIFILFVGLVVAYGAWAIAFRYLLPPDESFLADAILAVRGVFIDIFGPTHGPRVYLAAVTALALLFSIVVCVDRIGPDLSVEE